MPRVRTPLSLLAAAPAAGTMFFESSSSAYALSGPFCEASRRPPTTSTRPTWDLPEAAADAAVRAGADTSFQRSGAFRFNHGGPSAGRRDDLRRHQPDRVPQRPRAARRSPRPTGGPAVRGSSTPTSFSGTARSPSLPDRPAARAASTSRTSRRTNSAARSVSAVPHSLAQRCPPRSPPVAREAGRWMRTTSPACGRAARSCSRLPCRRPSVANRFVACRQRRDDRVTRDQSGTCPVREPTTQRPQSAPRISRVVRDNGSPRSQRGARMIPCFLSPVPGRGLLSPFVSFVSSWYARRRAEMPPTLLPKRRGRSELHESPIPGM